MSALRYLGAHIMDGAKAAGRGARNARSELKRIGNDMLDARDDTIISSMVKKTDPEFYNGYTGLKPTVGMNVAAFGLAGAYAFGASASIHAKPNPGTVEYAGESAIMSGDGMTKSSAPTLGASGSLVFGLNAMRRG